jgi:hypothetical protein
MFYLLFCVLRQRGGAPTSEGTLRYSQAFCAFVRITHSDSTPTFSFLWLPRLKEYDGGVALNLMNISFV